MAQLCMNLSQTVLPRNFASSGSSLQVNRSSQNVFIRQNARRPAVCTRAVAEKAEESAPAPGLETTGQDFKAVLDIEQIRERLPHRYPFLLVDRVVSLETGVSAVGYKQVTIGDEFFEGHFPQRRIMPGVLQIEAMAQLGGLVMLNPEDKGAQEAFFFAGIDKVRFRKPVVPGDTLMMHAKVTKFNKRFGVVKMETKAYVGSVLVCEAELTLAMGSG